MPTDTALHKAANQGSKDDITALLDAGEIPVNAEGAANRTALHRCCGGNHVVCAQLLLERNANINALDKSGRTPLHWACIGGHGDIVKLLLHWAIERKNFPDVPKDDTSSCKVNEQTKAGMTACASCCEGGKVKVMEQLVAYNKEVGAGTCEGDCIDFTIVDGDGKDCIKLAREGKHKDLLVYMEKEGIAPAGSSACAIS